MAVCLIVNLLVVAGIMFGRNARDSLFLIYFGVQYLPVMYFANAVFLIACSVAYTTLVDRIERGRFFAGVSMLFVASLIVSRVVLVEHPHWFFPVLYIQAQVIWYFSLMQFWTFAGDLFDTRQAKRLFPFLAVGALLGMILVGLGSRHIVKTLGTENLLLVWAVLIFASLLLGAVAFKRYRQVSATAADHASAAKPARLSELQKIKEGFGEVAREPLLRSMAGYILLMWTVYAVVDFCFNKTMRARYPNPNDLTTFFGIFVGVQGLLCLLIQVFLTRPVIARLGVGTTVNFHPAFLFVGTAWMGVSYGYTPVLSTKLADASMLYTFSDSSYQLLYNPVPLEARARVRGFIEGYIRPLSLAAAGALVLLGNSYLKPIRLFGHEISTGQQLSWGALVFAAIWLGTALTANKGYVRALLKNLQSGSPALRHAAATALSKIQDATSLGILSETLRGQDPERIVVAIQLLEQIGGSDAAQTIAALLNHPEARVRATAATAMGRLAGKDYTEPLLALLDDPDPRVRANAVEALASFGDPALVEKIRPLLTDPFTRARVNTILTMASIQGVSSSVEWMPQIQELARGDPQSRATATYALGRLPLEQSEDMLVELLRDPELGIRREAAQALGRIGSSRIIPALVEALASPPELRHATRKAIAKIVRRHGEAIAQQMADMADRAERVEIRSELVDVLGRLHDPHVIDTLVRMLKDPEWRVRWKVLKAFGRIAKQGPLPETARAALFEYAHGELEDFKRSLAISRAVVPKPQTEPEHLLATALEEDRTNIEERVFRMLGVLCGRDRMQAVFAKIRSGDARQRADALEALDSLAPKKLGRQVLAVLEPAPTQAAKTPADATPLLAELARHPKPWVRACTAYYAGLHAQDGKALLGELLNDRDPLVRETALYAGWKAFGGNWRPQVEQAASSSDALLARAVRRIQSEQKDGNPGLKRGEPMLLTVEKVLFLKSAAVFAGIEGEELAALAEITLEHEYAPGDVIFEEGKPAHHLYVVVNGRVEVFRTVNDRERPLAVLGPRECFGEMAILDEAPRSASIRAIEPTTVLKIDRESFRELILERPQIAFAIFKILSGRLRTQNIEADSLPAYDVSRNIA